MGIFDTYRKMQCICRPESAYMPGAVNLQICDDASLDCRSILHVEVKMLA